MAELEIDNQEAMEIPPLNFEAEFANFENIIHQNTQYHQQVSQKYIKSSVKSLQEPITFENLDEAIQTIYEAAHKVDSVNCEVNQKQNEVVAVGKEFEEISKKINLTAKSAQEFSAEADKKQDELKSLVATMSDKGDVVEQKRMKLSSELTKWRSILGLELVNSSHGGIIFVFTNIDRENPDKKFSCEVGIEGRHYKLSNCLPVVTGLDKMLELLNKTNDLSGFVVNLRKKFVNAK